MEETEGFSGGTKGIKDIKTITENELKESRKKRFHERNQRIHGLY